jgi:polyphosphate kinase 2 (PPK2 family)
MAITKSIWKHRFRHIKNFESSLSAQGTVLRKFFLLTAPKNRKKQS